MPKHRRSQSSSANKVTMVGTTELHASGSCIMLQSNIDYADGILMICVLLDKKSFYLPIRSA